jgi:hypothetical protein
MRTGRILLIVLAMPCVASAVGLADELVQITRPLMIARLLPAVVNIISYVGTAEPPSGNVVTAARDRPEPGGAHAARRNGRRAHRSATA